MAPKKQGIQSVGERVRDACTSALDAALELVAQHPTCPEPDRPEHLRLIRRSTKRLRALLPFFEEACRAETLAGLERMLREASGLLAPTRDRDAILATVHRLFDGRSGPQVEAASTLLSSIIAPEGHAERERAIEDLLVERAGEMLREIRAACLRIDPEGVDEEHVADSMAQAWRLVRRTARRGWEQRDSEQVHGVRKRCARIIIQCGIFQPLRKNPFSRLRRQLRGVTSALGDERDLAMLAERIAVSGDSLGGGPFTEEVLAVALRARARLRGRAAEALKPALTVKPSLLRRGVLRAVTASAR